jgi:hypothetical protein
MHAQFTYPAGSEQLGVMIRVPMGTYPEPRYINRGMTLYNIINVKSSYIIGEYPTTL